MVIKSYLRGHEIVFINRKWVYEDTKELAIDDRACIRCGKLPTKKGYDHCIGKLEGVISACCGHGVEKSYRIKDK